MNFEYNYNQRMESLNKDQLDFIVSPIQHAKLLGNPGCGKTRSIIEFIINKKLAKNEFFVTTFSRSAKEDFLKKGKQKSKVFTDKNVRTIHSLSFEIYKKITRATSKFLNTLIISTKEHLAQNPDAVKDFLKDIKVIVVDEAQDISKTQYDFIMTLSEICDCKVILVGDPNQNIFQFQGGSDKYLLNHEGTEFKLMTNYRSSQEIINFLNQIRPHKSKTLMTCGSEYSDSKPIVFNGSPEDIEKYLVSKILELKSNGMSLGDIAIIGSMKKSKSSYASIGLSFVAHALADAGIEFLQHYNDGKEGLADKNIKKEEDKVNLMTCHGSKGLEFETTIVINYHLNTFSRKPTESDYYQHNYLWYVGLSRAKKNLIICVNSQKDINPQISEVSVLNYTRKGSPLKIKSLDKTKFAEDIGPVAHIVTDVITDNKYFDEHIYLEIQKGSFVSCEEVDLSFGMDFMLELDPQYAALHGKVMELMFQYEFFKQNGNVQRFANDLSNYLENLITVGHKYEYVVQSLKRRGIIDSEGETSYTICDTYKNKSNDVERKLMNMIMNNIRVSATKNNANHERIRTWVLVNNNAQEFDKLRLIELCDQIKNTSDTREVFDLVFEISKYKYAYENEKRFWNDLDFQTQKDELFEYYDNIIIAAEAFKGNEFEFEVPCKHPLIELIGQVDAISETDLIELKFTNEITEIHKTQVMLYMACTGRDIARIVNMKKMTQVIMTINPDNKWKMHELIAKALKSNMPKKMIILDLETNSKKASDKFPIIASNEIEIIDHHLYELATNSAVSSGLVKNQWPITNSHIHGIEDSSSGISKKSFQEIMMSLGDSYLVAHNGIGFDFKVLEALDCIPANCSYIDSMNILRSFAKLGGHKDVKLESMYKKFIDSSYVQTHRAEEDVSMILALFKYFNMSYEKILLSC